MRTGPKVVRPGKDITIVTLSYTTVELLRLVDRLSEEGVDPEIVDLRVLNPFDPAPILESVRKTRHLLVADQSWRNVSFVLQTDAANRLVTNFANYPDLSWYIHLTAKWDINNCLLAP